MKLSKDDREFLDGYLSAFDDFSYDAWQAACESVIEECPRFKYKDANEVWLAWCRGNAEKGDQ